MRCCALSSTFVFAALLMFAGCGESISPVCGDNTVQGTEVCDGTDLAGEDCVSQGFTGGTLGCLADCSGFDISSCMGCGNDIVEPPEQCDGLDLQGLDCTDFGFTGGTLGCMANCTFDTSGCTGGPVCGVNVINQVTEVCGQYSSGAYFCVYS